MAGARTAVEASYLDHCNGQDGLNSDKSLSLCDEAEITNRESAPCSANNLMKIGSTSAGYDAAGDLTSDGVHTYQYNAEGQMISVDNGSTATYLYDALGNRVRKVSGGYTLDSQYDIEGRQVAYGNTSPSFVTWQDFLYAGGRFAGFYASGTRFVHTNLAQSSTELTNQAGTETQDELYYPWGGRWVTQGTVEDERFAGLQRRDSETELDPTHFRTYNSSLGRWMTPDPMGGDVTNPQSLNRYAYVLNNPTTFTDPLGLHTCGRNGLKVPNGSDPVSWCKTHMGFYGGDQSGYFTNNGDEFDLMNTPVVDASNPVWVPASNVSTVSGGVTFEGPWATGYWTYPTIGNAMGYFAGALPAQWSGGGMMEPVNGDVPLPEMARVVLPQVYKSTQSLESPWAPVMWYGVSGAFAGAALFGPAGAEVAWFYLAAHPAVVGCAADLVYGFASPPGASSGWCGTAGQTASAIWNSLKKH